MKHRLLHRLLLFALGLLCAAIAVQADGFVHLDWRHFAQTGRLPRTVQVIPLGADYGAVEDYRVALQYPETAPMSKAECQQVRRLGLEPQEAVTPQVSLGVSRKEGLLEVAYLPIFKQGGKFYKLLSCKVSVERQAKAKSRALTRATGNARYADHSVLREGRWAKIRVREEGVYALTSAFLRNLGFNNLARVKVYGYGGWPLDEAIKYSGGPGQFDDLEEVPLLRRANDLLFYAQGTVKWSAWKFSTTTGCYQSDRTFNPYSDYSYYFVTEGDEPMAFPQAESLTPVSQPAETTVPDHCLIEQDGFSWLQSGRNQYDPYNYQNGSSKNYAMPLPDAATDSPGSVTISFSAGNNAPTNVQLLLNGNTLGSFTLSKIADQYTYATAAKHTYRATLQAANTFNIKTTSGMAAHLDYLSVCYTRRLHLRGDQLTFSYAKGVNTRFALDGADSHTEVWRIGTAPGQPTAKVPATLGTDGKLSFVLGAPNTPYVALNTAAAFPTPEAVGVVANQDLHADPLCDMVIIIPASGKLRAQAERLAAYHRQHDSLRVNVVGADQIYNEFSSGTPDAVAYRKYVKMLYDRAPSAAEAPRYLLLFGSCVWDNRMLSTATRGLNPNDYLLCYESDENAVSEIYSYVSDDFFGLMDDGEGAYPTNEKIDLGIGRIPVTKAAEAEQVVDKLIGYMDGRQSGAWKNTVCLIADDGDQNKHMQDADTVVRAMNLCHPELHVRRVYLDAYRRQTTSTGHSYPGVTTDLKNLMRKGALIMDYSGHGAPYTLTHEQVLKLADFRDNVSANIPLWVAASCEVTPYDMLADNIGETSLLNRRGGAVAFYSSARAAYSAENRSVNNYFTNFVLGRDADGRRHRLGDAARLAKVALVSTVDGAVSTQKDFSINKLKYALMGDPALTLAAPTERVVIDRINGRAVDPEQPEQLRAGSVAQVEGRIVSYAGAMLGDFDGKVTLTLYDSQDTVTCHNNQQDADRPYVYREHTKVLFEGSDSVRGGRFTMSVPVPMDINYSGAAGQMNFYAVNARQTLEANGTFGGFLVGGTADNALADSLGPKMFIYLNDPDFKDGGTVNERPNFYARLSDDDGINRTGNAVGHDLELIIDGNESTSYILNDYFESDFGHYTSGTVAFHIPTLPAGPHRLYFRAWDVKNNSSSQVLRFTVQEGLRPALTGVKASPNPAHSGTQFHITYDRPDCETTFRIRVYDCFGRLWWSHEETGETATGHYAIPWDLTANNGVALPSGLYICRVSIACQGSGEVTATDKLIIQRQ